MGDKEAEPGEGNGYLVHVSTQGLETEEYQGKCKR